MWDAGALFLLFVFSVLFAMVFNYGGPKFMSFLLSKPYVSKYGSSYAGKTLLTAITVFVFLVAVSVVMSFAGQRPKLPAA